MRNAIIEHPTRGVLTDLPGERSDKPHFSWARGRSEAKMMTEARARLALDDLPNGCYVLVKEESWVRRS